MTVKAWAAGFLALGLALTGGITAAASATAAPVNRDTYEQWNYEQAQTLFSSQKGRVMTAKWSRVPGYPRWITGSATFDPNTGAYVSKLTYWDREGKRAVLTAWETCTDLYQQECWTKESRPGQKGQKWAPAKKRPQGPVIAPYAPEPTLHGPNYVPQHPGYFAEVSGNTGIVGHNAFAHIGGKGTSSTKTYSSDRMVEVFLSEVPEDSGLRTNAQKKTISFRDRPLVVSKPTSVTDREISEVGLNWT